MNRGLASFLTTALFACALGVVGATQQPERQVFRGARDAVRVFATVTDRDGRLVTTLNAGRFRGSRRRQAAADHPVRQDPATDSPDRDARRLRQHGGQRATAKSRWCATLWPPVEGRRRARWDIRERGHDQPLVYQRCPRAQRCAADDDHAGCADPALARGRAGHERLWRRGRSAQGDPRAERRQGQRSDELSRASIEPGRRYRSRAPRGRDDLRHRHAQPH